MIETTILGFPRIGARRELKAVLESYRAGRATAGQLLATAARSLRAELGR